MGGRRGAALVIGRDILPLCLLILYLVKKLLRIVPENMDQERLEEHAHFCQKKLATRARKSFMLMPLGSSFLEAHSAWAITRFSLQQ